MVPSEELLERRKNLENNKVAMGSEGYDCRSEVLP